MIQVVELFFFPKCIVPRDFFYLTNPTRILLVLNRNICWSLGRNYLTIFFMSWFNTGFSLYKMHTFSRLVHNSWYCFSEQKQYDLEWALNSSWNITETCYFQGYSYKLLVCSPILLRTQNIFFSLCKCKFFIKFLWRNNTLPFSLPLSYSQLSMNSMLPVCSSIFERQWIFSIIFASQKTVLCLLISFFFFSKYWIISFFCIPFL